LVLQKQAKMKQNEMRFASFRFEAKILKDRKKDILIGTSNEFTVAGHCFIEAFSQKSVEIIPLYNRFGLK
jgi:hypothetical protein